MRDNIFDYRYYKGETKDKQYIVYLYLGEYEASEIIIYDAKEKKVLVDLRYSNNIHDVYPRFKLTAPEKANYISKQVDVLDNTTLAINIRNKDNLNERVILYFDKDRRGDDK